VLTVKEIWIIRDKHGSHFVYQSAESAKNAAKHYDESCPEDGPHTVSYYTEADADFTAAMGQLRAERADWHGQALKLIAQVNEKDAEIAKLRDTIAELDRHHIAKFAAETARAEQLRTERDQARKDHDEAEAENDVLRAQRDEAREQHRLESEARIREIAKHADTMQERDDAEACARSAREALQAEIERSARECRLAREESDHAKRELKTVRRLYEDAQRKLAQFVVGAVFGELP
jgi:SMC interacting uncharacterized protein involved in chromosome segregation